MLVNYRKKAGFKTWLLFNSFSDKSVVRIFCLPYAGGGASIYSQWASILSNNIELCPIQLPGRENRINEKPFDNVQLLVKELVEVIEAYSDKPYAIFGHSMGALICFELARELRKRNIRKPERLFLSGRNAPHIRDFRLPIHNLNQNAFIERLRELNGTPESVLLNEELMEVTIPFIRDDFKLVETYEYVEEEALDIPFTIISGTGDMETSIQLLNEWSRHTSSSFIHYQVKGDHFFINSNPKEILDIIKRDILVE